MTGKHGFLVTTSLTPPLQFPVGPKILLSGPPPFTKAAVLLVASILGRNSDCDESWAAILLVASLLGRI